MKWKLEIPQKWQNITLYMLCKAITSLFDTSVIKSKLRPMYVTCVQRFTGNKQVSNLTVVLSYKHNYFNGKK